MRHNKDVLWKGLLECVFDDFLRFVYADADQVFDFEKDFHFLDKELAELYPETGKQTDIRFVDKLVKVFLKGGVEEWVLVHIEVQGETKATDRAEFGERMFRYFYRIFDRYRKPVAAVTLFTGRDGIRVPGMYAYSFMNTRLEFQYHTLRVLDFPDEILRESKNPFSWVVLIAKQALLRGKELDKRLLEGKLFIFRKLYGNGLFDKRKLQAILVFLNNYVRFENQETNLIFGREIEQITGKSNAMDIFQQVAVMRREEALEQGRKEGMKQHKRLVVENLLKETDFSPEKIAALASVSQAFVKKVKAELAVK
jgi:hypothetical protein